ncbi:MAG: AAA family ATPase, partial [Gammaproteobacteria bacterium]|nr:AAA family ATPase [Gammaproteobacteria bacterium]
MQEAYHKRHEFVTPEHLLLALLDDKVAVDVLRNVGADLEGLRKNLETFIDANTPLIPGEHVQRGRKTERTAGFDRVVQRAIFLVNSRGNQPVNGADMLIAIFGEQESHAVYCLKEQSIARLDVLNYVAHGISKKTAEGAGTDPESQEEEGEGTAQPALQNFASDLNELARIGKVDPLVGRDAEVERVIQILCRRRKNNPLLVGESGVGKTAIAEGLAKRIVDGEVPDVVGESRVLALDLGALLAGTKYRVEFETRFKVLLAELKK